MCWKRRENNESYTATVRGTMWTIYENTQPNGLVTTVSSSSSSSRRLTESTPAKRNADTSFGVPDAGHCYARLAHFWYSTESDDNYDNRRTTTEYYYYYYYYTNTRYTRLPVCVFFFFFTTRESWNVYSVSCAIKILLRVLDASSGIASFDRGPWQAYQANDKHEGSLKVSPVRYLRKEIRAAVGVSFPKFSRFGSCAPLHRENRHA